jgi:putative PIN family toxin of toxin-antitoxin system
MRIVLDTNVFLVSLAPDSDYAPIFDALLAGQFTMLLSNEVVTEYEEIIARRYDHEAVQDVLRLLVALQNTELISPHYRWKFIHRDPDDDKFVDLAVAGNADFIVTNDKHFNALSHIPFPVVKSLKAEVFLEMLAERKR